MASLIRVNTINNRNGIGTITLNDDTLVVSGFTTFKSTDVEVSDGFFVNDQILNRTRSVNANTNAAIIGPYDIATGVTLSIETGATFSIL